MNSTFASPLKYTDFLDMGTQLHSRYEQPRPTGTTAVDTMSRGHLSNTPGSGVDYGNSIANDATSHAEYHMILAVLLAITTLHIVARGA